MCKIIRVNSISGRSYIIPLDKIIFIEESKDGDSSMIHLTENIKLQCTERIYDLEDSIKRISRE